MASSGLTGEELSRYDRQVRVLGVEGQLRLKRGSVLVVGAGGLGSAALYYLAAAGVGRVVVVDPGRVDLSDLNRQVLYTTGDVGRLKAYVARERLVALNPNVKVEAYARPLDEGLAEELVPGVDVVVDALDNWEARMLLNRCCVEHRKPLVHAGVRDGYGQLLVVIPGEGPCLSCVFPHAPKAVQRPLPVLGPIPGVLGALEAMEALKLLTGYGEPAVGRLILVDGRRARFTELKVRRSPSCPVCSKLT